MGQLPAEVFQQEKVVLRCVSFEGRIQPVIATHSLNRSAGVWKPSVLRGLSFNCLAIELS
jgi:hypothetical protein